MERVAIITGAGRNHGLGQGIARRLSQDGYAIVLHDIGETGGDIAPEHGVAARAEAEEVADALRADGAKVQVVYGDLLDPEAPANIVNSAIGAFGRIDALINNAGIGYLFGPIDEMDERHLDAVLGVNLKAPFMMIKHVVPHMRAHGDGGRIINIASQAAKSGFAFASAYTASKHGILGLTRSAALELAGDKITVNAVCPNHVTTGLGAWQNEFMSKARGQSVEDYLAEMRTRIPLGRPGLVDDTANACAFLCSPQAAYITAEALNVSGGEEYH